MPELPEVETLVRRVGPELVGQQIAGFWSDWPRAVRPGLAAARRALVGRRFESAGRRGKFAVFSLTGGGDSPGVWLLIHLRMSGRIGVMVADSPREPHTHAVWRLGNGKEFRFSDARKFGRVWVTARPGQVLDELGMEPLSSGFTAAWLGAALRRRRRRLKAVLLDQRIIAGIGNIYADESLHRAGLHPLSRSDRVTGPAVGRLRRAIVESLRLGIASGGASTDWVYPGGRMQEQFAVYGRAGERCGRCGGAIVRRTIAQRGTHFCSGCQRMAR